MDYEFNLSALIELYEFWFSEKASKFWFDSTPEFDETIKTIYSKLLDDLTIINISKHNLMRIEDNYRMCIGLILLHDQIPRHIYRNNCAKIKDYLDLILPFSNKIFTKYKYDLKPNDFCFVLLPYRHTNDFINIKMVIDETKIKIKQNPLEHIYKRFLKATLERYIKLNNDKQNIKLINDFTTKNNDNFDKQFIITDPNQICELELINYYPVKLTEFNKLPDYVKNTINDIKNTINYIKHNISVKSGIISLSGGVDSMCLSYILKYLGIDIIAVHINYNNRVECNHEVEIIKQWCKFLNIKLYVRTITELNRPEMMEYNMRDLYETYTRDIRFNTYINADDDINNNIFVGHNHDDQFENIFTNIISESHYDNLRGMKILTEIPFKDKQIQFIRPMLNIPKDIIYKLSRYFNIPHFKDSTPKWSQRGKIRDSVRPAIENWDKKAITSFFKLSDNLSDLLEIANISAVTIYENIKKTNSCLINLNNIYPKMLFQLIFERLDIKMSQKGLNSFYDKLLFIKLNKQKYKINCIEKYRLNKTKEIRWKNLNDNYIDLLFS
jgi:tRNA(Ile)-lysidine synthase TilS/MesJ